MTTGPNTGRTADPSPGPAFVPPAPPRRKWPLFVGAPVVAALLVLGGLRLLGSDDSCATQGVKTGPLHECIGVSDGSYAFEDSLKPVMTKIKEENDRVEKSGRKWVSVAYVQPITTDLAQQESVKYHIGEELQGAYLAQRQLNDAQLGGRGDTPQVRLLVANVGLRSGQWKPLADRLIAMTRHDHLVAVAGFGQSRGGTLNLVDALRAAKVPMMGATVTADNLASNSEVGFFRIAASNADQASAAARYLRSRQQSTPGYDVLVVRDRNTDDIYNTSLYNDFERAAAAQKLPLVDGDLEYVSGTDGISNAFSSVADRVCAKHPKAVFFAGRGVNMRGFITAMSAAGRRCPVTVLTGDDGAGVYYDMSVSEAVRKQFESNWRQSRVTAYFTALAHPELPGRIYQPDNNPYTDFRDLAHDEFGQTTDEVFQDGQAILGHDSVWMLGVAIRVASGDSGTAPVTTGSVLNALVSSAEVAGVSGPVSLDSAGNPQGKAMALVQLQPDGQFLFQQVVRP